MTDTSPNINGNNHHKDSDDDATRHLESPAQSHDSTSGSLDTIVDRSSLSAAELMMQQQQRTLAQSVNTTNEQMLLQHRQQQQQHDSLTNSQISMIRRNGASDDEQQKQHPQPQQRQQQQQQQNQAVPQQQQQQQQQLDAQSHIYSSPVYAVNPDQKPPLKLTAATLLESVDDAKKPKLISHEEFQQQLQTAAAARAANDSRRINKKQRFPPELIKIKDGGGHTNASEYASKQHKEFRQQHRCKKQRPKRTGPPFPMQIVLGFVQLLLAISLVALGSLLLVRESSLSATGCGIWTGLIAAVTGSMGVVSIQKTQTAFLALSLVCIATSTLALAISGVGLSRDINRMQEKFDLMNANNAISAASSLIFTLFLHFLVSIASVYRCAMQMFRRSEVNSLNDIIITTNKSGSHLSLDQDKIDHYIKAMSLSGSEKEKNEKLAAMWMYTRQMGGGGLPPPPSSLRKIKLIPSTCRSSPPVPPPPTAAMMLAPPPPLQYRAMSQPYMRPPPPRPPHVPLLGPLIYAPRLTASSVNSLHTTYQTQKGNKSADVNSQRRRRRAAAAAANGCGGGSNASRPGKANANRRQRRKSEADIVDGGNNHGAAAFTYTGLDRLIADSFLARQEQSNAGSSHIDYSSSTSSSSSSSPAVSECGSRPALSRSSSKAKIVCRDVKM